MSVVELCSKTCHSTAVGAVTCHTLVQEVHAACINLAGGVVALANLGGDLLERTARLLGSCHLCSVGTAGTMQAFVCSKPVSGQLNWCCHHRKLCCFNACRLQELTSNESTLAWPARMHNSVPVAVVWSRLSCCGVAVVAAGGDASAGGGGGTV